MAGGASLQIGDWPAARSAFEAALEHGESADALFGLGDALWWLGEVDAAIRSRERAYALFRRRSDAPQAAVVAMRLCLTYRANLGNRAASRGWLSRAARLVEDFHIDELRGWMLLTQAYDAYDPESGERLARAAHEIARRSGDADLELCALSELGAWLVESGRVEEGLALLDEAMAASLAGEAKSLNTVAYTSCHTVVSCSRTTEFERATEWVRVIEGFSRRYGCPLLYAMCRTLYGSVLFATGHWRRAEEELESALWITATADRAVQGEARAKLAELRLAQGRIEDAERLVAGYEDHAAVAFVVGMVRLVRGDPVVARSIANRRLAEVGDALLESAPLLELRAEAETAQDAAREALGTARRLAVLGENLRCDWVIARGNRALGHALLKVGDFLDARQHLEAALSCFARFRMPFETARTRLLLAAAIREMERETAVVEARVALSVFEELGAGREADRAAAFLRSLGVKAARVGPRGIGILTKRELEVLKLLGEGISNREIAERLFITRKTVEHHVARILSKLDLRSRAEAAAYAVRSLERNPVAN
jgi:DNA-binding CsgD family transcriptional regulator/predicted negative regulator of RcsB-dependent stress response